MTVNLADLTPVQLACLPAHRDCTLGTVLASFTLSLETPCKDAQASVDKQPIMQSIPFSSIQSACCYVRASMARAETGDGSSIILEWLLAGTALSCWVLSLLRAGVHPCQSRPVDVHSHAPLNMIFAGSQMSHSLVLCTGLSS